MRRIFAALAQHLLGCGSCPWRKQTDGKCAPCMRTPTRMSTQHRLSVHALHVKGHTLAGDALQVKGHTACARTAG